MGLWLRLPPSWSLCRTLTGSAQTLVRGAQDPMDGRMPSKGSLPASPPTPCGMLSRGARWLCWPCSWQGSSTSRRHCQRDVREPSAALGAAPWTVSSRLPGGPRASPCKVTFSPDPMDLCPNTLLGGKLDRVGESHPPAPRAPPYAAPRVHRHVRNPLRKPFSLQALTA